MRVLLAVPAASRARLEPACAGAFPDLAVCLPAAAVARAAELGAELVLVAADQGATPAERITSGLRGAGDPPLVVWLGASEARVRAAARFGPDDALPLDHLPATLPRVVARAAGQARLADEWSGRSFLERVDGGVQRFPPLRVLFLAHRLAASGVLEVQADGRDVAIPVQGGAVVGCRGLPDLLVEQGVEGRGGGGLEDLVGQLVARGMPPDRALALAADAVGAALARWWPDGRGRVRFDALALAPAQPLPIGVPVPRLLAHGLRAERPVDLVRASLAPHLQDRVSLRVPDDSPDARWGLDSVSLRVLRRCREGVRLERLLGEQGDEEWLAFDLLRALGLLRLLAPAPVAAAPADAPPAPAPPAEDAAIAALRAELQALEGAGPLEVLAIRSGEELSDEGLERAFRRRSVAFHPDRHRDAPPAQVELAKACFQRIVEARDALRHPSVRAEAQRRLGAAQRGERYVSGSDKRKAAMLVAEAELSFKRRQYAEARRQVEASLALDPAPWRARLLLLQCDWKEKARPGAAIAADLVALQGPTGAAMADVYHLAGEIQLAEGAEKAAQQLFKKAVDVFPDHVGARRRLRLHAGRQGDAGAPAAPSPTPGEAPAAKEGGSFLDGLFRRRS